MKHYALYKGDKFLSEGTLIQLSKEFNLKLKTLQFMLTPTYKKRTKHSKNGKKLIEI